MLDVALNVWPADECDEVRAETLGALELVRDAIVGVGVSGGRASWR